MQKSFILILLFTVCFSSIAQNTIEGFVFDKNGNPIEYCAITINNKGIGTYSDKKGFFSLKIDRYESEKIVFSHISYLSYYTSLDEYNAQQIDTVFLKRSNVSLKEVVINPEEYEKIKHRPKKIFFGKYYSYAPAVGAITAYHIKSYKSGVLSKVIFYYKRIKNPNIYVGVRIFRKSEKAQVKHSLLDTNIIYNLKINSKSLEINLKEYNIVIPSEGILVGLELIKDPCKRMTIINGEININSCFYIGLENSVNSEHTYVSPWNKKWSWWENIPNKEELNWHYNLMIGYEILVPK